MSARDTAQRPATGDKKESKGKQHECDEGFCWAFRIGRLGTIPIYIIGVEKNRQVRFGDKNACR